MQIISAQTEDAERLAGLRVAAMRPSLEAIGRFDVARARARLLDGFDPAATWLIRYKNQLAGFFVVRAREDHLLLDHLYVDPTFQGEGLGRAAVTYVQTRARRANLPVQLAALRDSTANAFYLSCGFRQTGADALDVFYIWEPR